MIEWMRKRSICRLFQTILYVLVVLLLPKREREVWFRYAVMWQILCNSHVVGGLSTLILECTYARMVFPILNHMPSNERDRKAPWSHVACFWLLCCGVELLRLFFQSILQFPCGLLHPMRARTACRKAGRNLRAHEWTVPFLSWRETRAVGKEQKK